MDEENEKERRPRKTLKTQTRETKTTVLKGPHLLRLSRVLFFSDSFPPSGSPELEAVEATGAEGHRFKMKRNLAEPRSHAKA